MILLISHYGCTPVNVIWDMPLTLFLNYYRELPEVVRMTSPWGSGESAPRPTPSGPSPQGTVRNEAELVAMSSMMGWKVERGNQDGR
jgi:hypothetical protein